MTFKTDESKESLMATQERLVDRLAELPQSECREELADFLRTQLAHILNFAVDEAISPRQRLSDLGLDSRMMVELKNDLESGLGVELGAAVIFYPTVGALLDYLTAQVAQVLAPEFQDGVDAPNEGETVASDPSTEVVDANVAELLAGLDDLPAEVLAALLSDLSEELDS
ncbi:acyl carrier protein [Chloroflexi bacterium TSY]|nr:acyl carrier protein [Chloroflexi bacterium TSY]